MTRPVVRLAVPLAAVAAFLLAPADAQPPLPAGSPLRYVPADAAMFVHADAAAVWGGPLGAALRAAEPKFAADTTTEAKKVFGIGPEQVRTVTAFWPKVRGDADLRAVGVVVVTKAPADAAALVAAIDKAKAGDPVPVRAVAKDGTTVVVLVDLPDRFAAPRPDAEPGPLTPYLREAAAGHAVSAGATFASLPDEIRGDDLPGEVRAFQPIFRADAIGAFVDQGKEYALEVRVKAATAVKAGEAEKALGLLVALAGQGLDGIPAKELADPAVKNLAAIMTAAKGALKRATFATTGTEARARVAVPADLPVAAAAGELVAKVRAAAARTQSFNNLKQIALALHSYHDTYGALPPAAVVDKTGRPLLSWRVLILPYVEQQALFQRFKLDEPWDGPNNKKLLDPMPKVFAMPAPSAAKATETHYQAFVGKGAAFDLLKGPKLFEFADGTSNTVMVGTAATAVPWTKPDDMAFDPAGDMTKVLGFFPDTAQVAFGDGSVRAMRKTITKQTLHALITRNGGEVIPFDDF